MSRKKTAALISAVAIIVAAVTAVVVFREQIGNLLDSLGKKKTPEFTPEEIEVFADI